MSRSRPRPRPPKPHEFGTFLVGSRNGLTSLNSPRKTTALSLPSNDANRCFHRCLAGRGACGGGASVGHRQGANVERGTRGRKGCRSATSIAVYGPTQPLGRNPADTGAQVGPGSTIGGGMWPPTGGGSRRRVGLPA